jgi:hypothetical protein
LVTISIILTATFASAVIIGETVVQPNNESKSEYSASKQKTQDTLQALNEP